MIQPPDFGLVSKSLLRGAKGIDSTWVPSALVRGSGAGHTRTKAFSVAILAVFIIGQMIAGGTNQSFAEELTSGTGSRKAKQQALQSLPFQELNPQTRAKVNDILQQPSIYRRLPVTVIDIDPDYFVFLARHPEVIVNIWKIMGVTKMTTTRTGPFTIATDDGVGTVSNVELVYGTNNIHIFYGEGTYEGPVFKRKLRGECVLVLSTKYQVSVSGKPTATSQLDVFLKIENATVGMIARTLNPIIGSTADHNFVESLNFLERLNTTTSKNGIGVQRMANRLTDVNNDTRREFVRMAGLVYGRTGGKASLQNTHTPPSSFSIPAYPAPSHPTNAPYSPRINSTDAHRTAYPSQSSNYQQQTAPISASFGDPQYHYGQPVPMMNQAAQAGFTTQPTLQPWPSHYRPQQVPGYQSGYAIPGMQYRQPPPMQRPANATGAGYPNMGITTNPQMQAAPQFRPPVYPPQNYYHR